ncbi:MAG: hypothetical protein FWD99_04500 [Oscillospiraceae bacterium]|nr:hypothetical protein [Oscillospiraceae bacterium]
MSNPLIISFPHMGAYHIPIRAFLGRLFPEAQVISAPPITRETAALGQRHSPDFICEPFKYNMGNFIQALDTGANVLFQTGMGCRYGYYGELQEQILRDLGYDFQFLCLSRDRARPQAVYQTLRKLGSPRSAPQMAHILLVAATGIRAMDKLAGYIRENMGFAASPGHMLAEYDQFLAALKQADTVPQVHTLTRISGKRLRAMRINRPSNPLRVGIVGDLYTVMEPFSNFDIEHKLAARGIAISRKMSVSFLLFGEAERLRLRKTQGYLRHPVGANGLDSVAQSVQYASHGYDGVIHIKSFGCTPELNAIPAMNRISRDLGIPILHMSFDTHSSETGVDTRLEAFVDMMEMRRTQSNANALQLGRGRGLYLHKRRRSGWGWPNYSERLSLDKRRPPGGGTPPDS